MTKKEQTYEQWSTNHYKEIKDWTIQTPLITNGELRKGKKTSCPTRDTRRVISYKIPWKGFHRQNKTEHVQK